MKVFWDCCTRICLKAPFFIALIFLLSTSAFGFVGQLPPNYRAMNACEKQDELWQRAVATQYPDKWPELAGFGPVELYGLIRQYIQPKRDLKSDISPEKWEKYLHKRGALAKVKIVASAGHDFTGIFQHGAECALLRLSLTYKPSPQATWFKKFFAPGLALKVLRDRTHSVNVSALYRLEGQGSDFNFFKNSMSNIVPMGLSLPLKKVHGIFRKVTDYPEELLVTEFAEMNAFGQKPLKKVSPRQIFFVPNENLKFSSDEHDFREDLLMIPVGTPLYQIRVAADKYRSFDYAAQYDGKMAEDLLKSSTPVGHIVTTSEFVASEFGDLTLFFRHEMRKKSED